MLKKLIRTLALVVPMLFVACGGTTGTVGTDTATTPTTSTSTTASYAGTYTGSVTGVNAGPASLVVSSANAVTGNWSITNRTDDNGVPTTYAVTFDGKVDASGNLTANAFLEGALVMSFSGNISGSGALTGTYFEVAHPGDPAKSGAFTMQGPANGTTTTTTAGSGTGCTGSFVGSIDMPSHEERIAMRNESLRRRGIAVTGNDDIDNANAGGGGPDGGIYMLGTYAFETDANCNVIKGGAMVFGVYPYDITGQVNQDRTFALNWTGPMVGKIEANNTISGQFQHPNGEEYVYGLLSGTFTPNGKI